MGRSYTKTHKLFFKTHLSEGAVLRCVQQRSLHIAEPRQPHGDLCSALQRRCVAIKHVCCHTKSSQFN